MDAARWDRTYSGQYAEEMSVFLEERMAFLEEYWASPGDYCLVEEAGEVQWRSYAFRRGENAEILNRIPNVQWFEYETNEPFDLSQPVTQDVTVRMIEPDAPAS